MLFGLIAVVGLYILWTNTESSTQYYIRKAKRLNDKYS